MSGGAPWPDAVGVSNLNTLTASDPAFGDSVMIGPSYQSQVNRTIYETTTSYTRTVNDKYTNAELVPGVNVCKTGVGGGTSCGEVTSFYGQDICLQGTAIGISRQVYHLVYIEVDEGCFPGDSGGAVYKRTSNDTARAVGIVSARFHLDGVQQRRWAIDPVQNIGNNTNSHVWRSP